MIMARKDFRHSREYASRSATSMRRCSRSIPMSVERGAVTHVTCGSRCAYALVGERIHRRDNVVKNGAVISMVEITGLVFSSSVEHTARNPEMLSCQSLVPIRSLQLRGNDPIFEVLQELLSDSKRDLGGHGTRCIYGRSRMVRWHSERWKTSTMEIGRKVVGFE